MTTKRSPTAPEAVPSSVRVGARFFVGFGVGFGVSVGSASVAVGVGANVGVGVGLGTATTRVTVLPTSTRDVVSPMSMTLPGSDADGLHALRREAEVFQHALASR